MHRSLASLTVTLLTASGTPQVHSQEAALPATESLIPAGSASLYARVIGRGQPVIVLHGGPDFDHSYLLPGLDSLARTFRLYYYDQRGRGRSGANVMPADVTLASDIADIEPSGPGTRWLSVIAPGPVRGGGFGRRPGPSLPVSGGGGGNDWRAEWAGIGKGPACGCPDARGCEATDYCRTDGADVVSPFRSARC
jgi:hypothetical protein